jgi:hypothetical protein
MSHLGMESGTKRCRHEAATVSNHEKLEAGDTVGYSLQLQRSVILRKT